MESEEEIIKRRLIEAIESLMNQSKEDSKYFNEFHKQSTEKGLAYIERMKKTPQTIEEVRAQILRTSKDYPE